MNALVSRRGFLYAGLAAGAAGTGALLLHLPAADAGYRVLSSHEAALVEAVAGVLFPPGVFLIAGNDGGTAPAVDELLADYLAPESVTPFRALLRALDIGTLLSRGIPFTALSPSEAADVLEVWARADPLPRRLAFDSFRAVIGAAFLRRSEIRASLGWRAGCP